MNTHTDCRGLFSDIKHTGENGSEVSYGSDVSSLPSLSKRFRITHSSSSSDSEFPGESIINLKPKTGKRRTSKIEDDFLDPKSSAKNAKSGNHSVVRRNSLGYIVKNRVSDPLKNQGGEGSSNKPLNIAEQQKLLCDPDMYNNDKDIHIDPKTLYFVSITLGLFFVIVGALKMTPVISKDAYKEFVKQFRLYYKSTGFLINNFGSSKFQIKLGSTFLRKWTGYSELFSGLVFMILPERNYVCKIVKTSATICLAVVMFFNTFFHYSSRYDNPKLPNYSYSMPLFLLLLGKLSLAYFAYTDWKLKDPLTNTEIERKLKNSSLGDKRSLNRLSYKIRGTTLNDSGQIYMNNEGKRKNEASSNRNRVSSGKKKR